MNLTIDEYQKSVNLYGGLGNAISDRKNLIEYNSYDEYDVLERLEKLISQSSEKNDI